MDSSRYCAHEVFVVLIDDSHDEESRILNILSIRTASPAKLKCPGILTIIDLVRWWKRGGARALAPMQSALFYALMMLQST
jgi:hypothetical protein